MQALNRGLRWALTLMFAVGSAALVWGQGTASKDANDALFTAQTQQSPATEVDRDVASRLATVAELPDSPGVVWEQSQSTFQQPGSGQSNAAAPQPNNSTRQSAAQTTAPEENTDQQKLQRPVGTAVAGAPPAGGVTAAQPSGVAIAPAKQRRVRTIVLRVGAILGAGAAIGTVIALTEATPSRPPGAH